MEKRYFITIRQGLIDWANRTMLFSDSLENTQKEAEKLFEQVTGKDFKFSSFFTIFIEDNEKIVSRLVQTHLPNKTVSHWEQTEE